MNPYTRAVSRHAKTAVHVPTKSAAVILVTAMQFLGSRLIARLLTTVSETLATVETVPILAKVIRVSVPSIIMEILVRFITNARERKR